MKDGGSAPEEKHEDTAKVANASNAEKTTIDVEAKQKS